jgi:diacylglycerol kinase (ATP)
MRRFRYALNGLRLARRDRKITLHRVFALCAFIVSAILRISAPQWCAVIICCALVIALEIVNTAVETLCDKLSPERSEHIGAVKDLCAGAVLTAAIAAAAVGCVIFIPKIWELLK